MSFYGYREYVPVAERRLQAQRKAASLKKKGQILAPIALTGRKIAETFWGKAWCENLERYSDYDNRLPRGRAYVRNGSVIDLQIERGQVRALVSGSSIYAIKIEIAALAPPRWRAICRDCAGSIHSLVELLSGKLSKNVMERVCRQGDGLFPAPSEIKMSCSCPDWADMCKHVAATLYGVGARLDGAPELLFKLRGVDQAEMIAAASADLSLKQTGGGKKRLLADGDVAALFGVEMAPAPVVAKTSADRKSQKSKDLTTITPQAQASAPVSVGKSAPQPKRGRSPGGAVVAPLAPKKRQAAKPAKKPEEKPEKPKTSGTPAKVLAAPAKPQPGKTPKASAPKTRASKAAPASPSPKAPPGAKGAKAAKSIKARPGARRQG